MSNNIQRVVAFSNVFGPDAQAMLVQAATAWREAGLRVAGVVGANPSAEGGCAADHLRDLGSEAQVLIKPDRAAGAARVVQLVRPQVAQADIVVVSRFGDLEARQRGLWPLFLAATIADKPLLTTVGVEQKLLFERYAPQVQYLQPVLDDVMRWTSTAFAA